MRRVQVFIIVFVAALGTIFGLLAVGLYLATVHPTQYSSSWVGQMWGAMQSGDMSGMMGGGSNSAPAPSYAWIIPAALIGIGIVSGIGVAFYLAFPEIRTIKDTALSDSKLSSVNPIATASKPQSGVDVAADPYELISRTMTSDEKKVLDVLTSHDGKYLQKYIKSEAGLSRLKTHRIVARLADRGVVTVKQVGNTNEVVVSDWLRTCRVQKAV